MLKNILLLLLITTSSLYASQRYDELQAEYSKAVKAYRAHNYDKSYEILSTLYLSALSDERLNFYLGRSAYETGHYEVALAAFERVLDIEPSNIRSQLEMARVYFMLKMYEDSEALFREILQNPSLPKNVRTNIEMYLTKVSSASRKSSTIASIHINWLFDSNVNYGSIDDEYSIASIKLSSPKEKSDQAFETSIDLINMYDIGDKNGLMIKNKLSFYMRDYVEENEFDLMYFGYTPSLLYRDAKYTAELALGVDLLKLADINYLKTIYAMPIFEYRHSNTLRSIAYFKYLRKYFQNGDPDNLNAKHYEVSYALQKFLSPRSYFQANTAFVNEQKIDGNNPNVDYNEYRLNMIYANQFTTLFGSEFFAELKKRDYDDFSSVFGSTRSDESATASISLNAFLFSGIRLNLKALYNKVDSNQELYSYEKYMFTTGLSKSF